MANKQAYEIPSFYLGVLEANVDMSSESAFQYIGVQVAAASGTGVVGPAALVAPSAGGVPIIGVLQNNPQLAEAGQVMVHGVSKILCGGTFAIGALLMVNSSGAFVVATSTNYAVAIALEAGASGQISCALLLNLGKQ